MRVAKITIMAALVAFGMSAGAENLIRYGESIDGDIHSYDSESIRRIGGYVYVWVFSDYSKVKAVPYRFGRSRFRVSCQNETISVGDVIDYNADGTIYNSTTDSTFIPDRSIVPGSMMFALFKAVCN